MADAQTMKCPACAGPMVFDPGASQIHCEYCGSVFDQDELIRQYQEEQQASQATLRLRNAAGALVWLQLR